MKRRYVTLLGGTLLAAALLLVLALPCAAEENAQAQDITSDGSTALSGTADSSALLYDGSEATGVRFENGGEITLEGTQPIASLYLVWDAAPRQWQVNYLSEQVTMGESQYLHQYVTLPKAQSTVKLSFEGPAVLCEFRRFTEGTPPPDVQNWSAPLGKADLLLLPTHADDEHIYFGGAIPTYTARGKAVQVAYMVNHNGEPHRRHELLNGLWTAGIRNYPVISQLPDQYSPSLEHAKTIYNPESLLAYQVGLIRRFQPEVIVGHDINGEYGHGAHRLNAATLQQAVVQAADGALYRESLLQYGAWDTKKTYLHLWAERPVVMDWNVPLPSFGGATAFEVAEQAFACHRSQMSYFKVEQTGPYDCRKFGLFRTTVGDDTLGNDFFENIEAS